MIAVLLVTVFILTSLLISKYFHRSRGSRTTFPLFYLVSMTIAVPMDLYRIEDADEVETILSSRRWIAALAALHVTAFVAIDLLF